jgi:hypothetical protein
MEEMRRLITTIAKKALAIHQAMRHNTASMPITARAPLSARIENDTRYEKRAANSLAMVTLAAIRIWLVP